MRRALVALGVLLAGAAASAGEPAVRREVARMYPRPLYSDWGVDRVCVVDVTLGERGRPAWVAPVDCDEALFRWTRRRVRRDRWEREAPPGTVTRVTVTFEAPADAVEVDDPSYFRRRAGETCVARVDVAPDGRATLVETTPGCEVSLADGPPVPRDLLDRVVPRVCVATFLVRGGRVRQLELFRCELPVWGVVRGALGAWRWGEEPGRPWSVQVRLVGE